MDTRIGLANLGNTCFLNVILQVLRLSPAIGDMFLRHPSHEPTLRKDSKKKEFVLAFRTLILDFWRRTPAPGTTPSMIPRGFLGEFYRTLRDTDDDWYRPGQQADAAEALQYVLDSLHNGLSRKVAMDVIGDAVSPDEESQIKAIRSWSAFFAKEYSPIVKSFNGQMQIRVVCSKCNTTSERYEPWLMMKAPIPGADTAGSEVPTMNTCLNAAFAEEVIEDYSCETCKSKERATIHNKISHLPPVTIVTLKRFTNGGQKVRGRITWDLDSLDFSPWMAFQCDPLYETTDVNTEYVTYAVVEHMGSTRGGHYRMYARQGDVWNAYDDSSVSLARPENVVTADSYIAILMPKNTAESMVKRNDQYIQKFRSD
jgi:ubiquitin C-terminal hydrolase